MNINKFGKGGLIKPLSRKDYRLEAIPTATILPPKYEIDYAGKLKNQDGSGSCVSQAVACYAELLNFKETGKWEEFSARDLYSLCYVEPMGSYTKDNMSKMQNSGIVLELLAPSYDDGKPPSEEFMRNRDDITDEEVEEGKDYMIERYLTWNSSNVDLYKQAILQGNGCVAISWGNNSSWEDGDILVPDSQAQMTWRHGILLLGWDDEKKVFKFLNSWGAEWGYHGYGYLPYEYVEKGYLANPMTMIDIKNDTYFKMKSQIKNITEQIRIIKLIIDLKNKLKELLNVRK